MKCRTSERGRARTARAFTIKDLIGVTLNILCLLWIKTEAVADKLLEHRLVTLALRIRAREKDKRAGAVKTNFRPLGARCTCALDRVGQSKAVQLATFA